MPEPDVILKLLSDGGVLVGCIIIIGLLVNERLVPRSRLEALQKELDRTRAEQATRDERTRQAMVDGLARMAALESRISQREETILASLTIIQRGVERVRAAIVSLERAVDRLRTR